MKHQVLTSLIAAGFAALLGTTLIAGEPRQTAKIPFAFEAGGRTYSEGNYIVERLNGTAGVKITNVDTGRAALIPVPLSTGMPAAGADPKLVFRQTGERMSLGEVWFAGYPGMKTFGDTKDLSAKIVVGLK